jgi:HK97 gp10 family phage protein
MPAKLTGLKEMQDMLTALPRELQESVAFSALRAGANLVAEEVRARAPIGTPPKRHQKRYGARRGALRDSVRVTRGTISGGVARVSVLVGSHRKGDSNVFWAKWVEFGTAAHWITVQADARPSRVTRRGPRAYSVRTLNTMAKRGSLKIGENFVGQSVKHPGARPKPFLRPAMDSRAQDAHRAIADQLRKKLARIGRNQPERMAA